MRPRRAGCSADSWARAISETGKRSAISKPDQPEPSPLGALAPNFASNPTLRGTMTKLISFETDILPLFTQRDIHAMSKAFNLANYDDVKKHAAAIYDRIRGIGGAVMPPPPPRGEGPRSQSRIDLFAKWMTDGYQP